MIAAGRTASLQDFVVLAFGHFSLDWRKHVR
jgi:hypothetical protein